MTLPFRRGIAFTIICGMLAAAWPTVAAEPKVAELIEAAKSTAEATRIKAIDQLAALGEKGAEAAPTLIEILGDGSAVIRAHAAHALGEMGNAAKPAAAVPQTSTRMP